MTREASLSNTSHLIHSIANGASTAEIEILLKNVANLNHADLDGITPLIAAASANRADLIVLFHHWGAWIEQKSPVSHWTPLIHAAVFGARRALQALLLLGADPVYRYSPFASPVLLAHAVNDPWIACQLKAYKQYIHLGDYSVSQFCGNPHTLHITPGCLIGMVELDTQKLCTAEIIESAVSQLHDGKIGHRTKLGKILNGLTLGDDLTIKKKSYRVISVDLARTEGGVTSPVTALRYACHI